jgi:D-alanyl-lipoteichoic acid acyltransferase DltB (MBOAT superfamily)
VIFHSLDFVAFFVLTTAVYWRLPHRGQNILLLGASYLFYGYVHPWFLALIAATTVADYWAARGMERWPARKRLMLGLSLAVNLGLLGVCKYFNFFAGTVQEVLALAGLDIGRPALSVVLPVGISFYTFQELSYTIEVYRGTLAARRDFIDFAAFVCFYPQLVAGPIERASHLLPQMEQRRVFSWTAARSAALLMIWGYAKKLVIADNVGVVANKVFALSAPGFTVLWAGVFAFAIQIYADFSAYSDIARGAARWLGFDLMRNFNHPYMATGPIDFWRRWHISLSTWFRDYVYIPLGGSRGTPEAVAGHIMVTFLLSGFWHGASWNYVIWGGYHGVLVAIAHALRGVRRWKWAGIVTPVRVVGTFTLVLAGWLMFRETELHMLVRDLNLRPWDSTRVDRQVGGYLFLLAAAYSLPLWVESLWTVYVWPGLAARAGGPERTARLVVDAAFAGLAFALILVLRSRQSLDFIYFQF